MAGVGPRPAFTWTTVLSVESFLVPASLFIQARVANPVANFVANCVANLRMTLTSLLQSRCDVFDLGRFPPSGSPRKLLSREAMMKESGRARESVQVNVERV